MNIRAAGFQRCFYGSRFTALGEDAGSFLFHVIGTPHRDRSLVRMWIIAMWGCDCQFAHSRVNWEVGGRCQGERRRRKKRECGGYFVFVNDSSYEFDFSFILGYVGRLALSDDFVG